MSRLLLKTVFVTLAVQSFHALEAIFGIGWQLAIAGEAGAQLLTPPAQTARSRSGWMHLG